MNKLLDLITNAFLYLPVIILLVGTIAVTLSKKVGLGSILGLLLTGIIIGPYTAFEFIAKENVDKIFHFSELGVVLLLFIVGLEVQPRRLWAMRKEVFGLGSLQILLSGLLIALYFWLFNDNWKAAIVIGLTLALSSTAFVIQLLQENNELSSEHGRVGFAILLMQDLAIVPLLAMVSLLSNTVDTSASDEPVWLQPVLVVSALIGVVILGRVIVPWVLDRFAKQNNRESFLLFVTLAIAFAAFLMECVDLSMALGGFIMGMMLSSSKYGFQIHASVESTKTVLMSIFFVSVGMSIDFAALGQAPLLFVLHVLVILLVKTVILFILARIFGVSKEASTKIAFLLSQGGEFGFVLFGAAKVFGIIDDATLALGIGIISISMAFTPSLYAFSGKLAKRFSVQESNDGLTFAANETVTSARVVVAGYGDTGYVLAQMLKESGIPFIVIEKNPTIVRRGKQEGMPVYFGDITDPKLLNVVGIEQAQMVIVAIEHSNNAIKAVSTVRNYYPMVKILARALELSWADKLIEVGANWVVAENLESSLHIGSEALKVLGMHEDQVASLVNSLRKDESQVIYTSAHIV